jgi:hypothetical protein
MFDMDSNHRAVRGELKALTGGRCCLSWREAWLEGGGASRDRTDDPLVANQVLSQLSYGPLSIWLKLLPAISADITP